MTVTRYGKPVMKLVPVDEEEGAPPRFCGWMKGTVTVLGDIINPIEDVVWEADQ